MPIYKKLLELQKQNIVLTKEGVNPHFRSKFVPLNEVLEKVKEPLNTLGVVIVQEPSVAGLVTRLIDTEDDTEVSAVMPWVGADNPQKMLACTTYYRRGTLVSLLGLEDEDDDGETASAAQAVKKVVAPKPVAITDDEFNSEAF